jgi:hypothetical protein
MGSFSFRVGSYCSSLHFLDTLFCTHTHNRDGRVHQKKLKRENNHQKMYLVILSSHSFGTVILWIGRSVLSTARCWRSGRFLFLAFTSSEGSGGFLKGRWRGRAGLWPLTVRCLVLLRREPLAVTNAESNQLSLTSFIGTLALDRSVRSLGWLHRLVLYARWWISFHTALEVPAPASFS